MPLGFNGARLRLARQLLGLTQRDLADRVALSDAMITQYENGQRVPRDEVVEALAAVLEVTPSYFYGQDDELFDSSQLNFRDQITATERLRKRVVGYANFFAMVIRALEDEIQFPVLSLPQLPDSARQDVESAAATTRSFWGLHPRAPIGRVGRVLENAGAIWTSLRFDPAEIEKVDALSAFGTTSIVLANTSKESVSRARWNLAHELAHGVLHRNRPFIPLAEKESEANDFAGAFLIPQDAFLAEFQRASVGFDGLLEMKLKWGVSVQAILMRARRLGLLNVAELRVWYRKLSRRGWRRFEPAEWPVETETPELFESAARQFAADPVDKLANRLGWMPSTVTRITGLVPQTSKSNGVVSLAERRVLRTT